MNYELKNIKDLNCFLVGQSRKIKLRQASFANTVNVWMKSVSSDVVEAPEQPTSVVETPVQSEQSIPVETNTFNPENNVVAEENVPYNDTVVTPPEVNLNKVAVNVGNLADTIMLVDEKDGLYQTFKRRVLAISSEMYNNITTNVNNAFSGEANTNDSVNTVDEEEIKQAVKDAFDRIDFNQPVVDDISDEQSNDVVSNDQTVQDAFDQIDFNQPKQDEVVISPEEVTNTIEDTNNISFTYDDNVNNFSNDIDIPVNSEPESEEKINFEENIEDNKEDDNQLFNFENINFDKIDVDKEEIAPSIDNDVDTSNLGSVELDDLLSEVKELQAEKDEQERKTADSEKLAMEKEQEKEKAKADFINYKTAMKEELDKSKKAEEENLARAKEAEEFTAALSNVMNGSANMSMKF